MSRAALRILGLGLLGVLLGMAVGAVVGLSVDLFTGGATRHGGPAERMHAYRVAGIFIRIVLVLLGTAITARSRRLRPMGVGMLLLAAVSSLGV